MSFQSILFDSSPPLEVHTPPDCLSDLRLDQVIQAITAHREEYNLTPFYYAPLDDDSLIRYRQEVCRDLQQPAWNAHVKAFADQMGRARRLLAMTEKLDYPYHRKGWFLEAALTYGEAVRRLHDAAQQTPLYSSGFLQLKAYLQEYVASPTFEALWSEAQQVKTALAEVRYNIRIQPGRFSVQKYNGEADYSQEVERTFARFKQGEVKRYQPDVYKGSGMNHIEAQILDFVVRLYPEPFAALDAFCERHPDFMDRTLLTFDREVQFYLAYLDYIAGLQESKGGDLPFCLPELSPDRQVEAQDAFDLALANALRNSDTPLVLNDFALHDPERILVITGPNQGGKTTFARMFAQLHYLAALGLPVPARWARLALFDRILTHFEREENVQALRGKLQDDLVRIQALLAQATPRSIFILNEIFSSTTLQDALFLSCQIMQRLSNLDALGVWVTFLDELATFNEKTVSMVSTVSPENPAERTFKILRLPANGLAYALSLAEKHRLTYSQLLERIRP